MKITSFSNKEVFDKGQDVPAGIVRRKKGGGGVDRVFQKWL
jgi:hypothetical protein